MANTHDFVIKNGLQVNENSTVSADISLGDNNKLKFGASDDLQIYHDGSNSFIKDAGTGYLVIQANAIGFANAANNENLAFFTQDGAATLYYDNVARLATTSTGIDVTGTIEIDTLSIGGTTVSATPAELNLLDGATVTTTEINYNDITTLGTVQASKTVTANSSGNVIFPDSAKALFGSGSDLFITHDGTNTVIRNSVGTFYIDQDLNDGDIQIRSDNGSGSMTPYFMADGSTGSATLYHYGSGKIATTSTGVTVTGNIVVSGTVDGRDLATDGTKLDGIESGATADQTITAGSGLTGGGTGDVTLYHADTSSQASVDNSNGTVVQDITLDGYGHVTALGSVNLDGRYYTETEADSRFANVAGDTFTGLVLIDQELKIQNGSGNHTHFNYNDGSNNYIRGGTTYVDTVLDLNNNNLNDVGNLTVNTNISVGGTVDGVDIAAFKTAYDSHNHDSRYYTESEADSRFLNVTGDTMTGDLVTTSGNGNGIFIGSGGTNITSVTPSTKDIVIQDVAQIRFGGASWDWNAWAGIAFNDSTEVLTIGGPASSVFSSNASPPDITINFDGLSGTNGLTYEGSTIWHAGNDGSGSGLDADTVDGVQLSGIVQRDYQDTGRNLNIATESTGSAGLFMKASDNSFRFQLYGDGTRYGFLYSDWGNWDLRKERGGVLYLNNNTNYYLDPAGTSVFSTLRVGGNTSFTTGGAPKIGVTLSAGDVFLTAGSSTSQLMYFRQNSSVSGMFEFQTYNSGNAGTLQLQPYGGGVTVNASNKSNEGSLDIMGSQINGTQAPDWSSDGVSYNSYGDVTITRRHGVTSHSTYGFSGPMIDFRSQNTAHEWSVGQIMGVVDPLGDTSYSGGLAFLTSDGGSTNPTGRRTNGAAPKVGMVIGNGGIVMAPRGSFRAPIFYDSNDTGYYLNPNDYSSMWGIAIRGDYGSTDYRNQIFFWSSGGTTTSAIGFKANGGVFTNPTGNGDGYNTYLTMDTVGRGWVFRRGTGGTDFSAAYTSGWILNNGIWQANASMRAPIFYDSANTSYYVDPASGFYQYVGTSTGTFVTTAGSGGISVEGNNASGPKVGIKSTASGGEDLWLISNNSNNAGGAGKLQLWNNSGGFTFAVFGTANTSDTTYIYCNLTASGNVTAYSDERLKENVVVIPNALDKVKAIRGVTFNRNDMEEKPRHAGVIAQEVEKVLPEVVSEDNKGIKTVAYGNMVGLLIEAIKELKDEVDDLKAQLAAK